MDLLSIDALLEALEEHGADKVIKATRKRPISSFALRDLYSNYADKKPAYRLFLAQYPLIPSELALAMIEELPDNRPDVAAALAANPRSPQQGLHQLATHPDPAVRRAVAENPNASPKECQLLAQDENALVRAAVAANPALPTFLQFPLAVDPDPSPKIALAQRENLDPDVAHQLSRDPSALVKTALIQNPALEPELFQMWADGDDEILQSLLLRQDKRFPASVRDSLRLSPHASVRLPALERAPLSLAEMLWLAESDAIEDRVFLAQKPNLPAAIQRILAQDTSEKARRYLAASESLQTEIAERIATSHDLQACCALAKNPNASPQVLEELCLHPDPQVATLVAYRDDLSDAHWDLLLNQRADHAVAEHIAFLAIDYPNLEAAAAQRFAASPNPSLRAFAAAALDLPPASLAALAQDLCDKVREAAAQNPNLPEPQLRALAYDAHQDIANAAEKSLAQRIQSATTTSSRAERPSPFASASRPTPSSDARRKILTKIVSFFKE